VSHTLPVTPQPSRCASLKAQRHSGFRPRLMASSKGPEAGTGHDEGAIERTESRALGVSTKGRNGRGGVCVHGSSDGRDYGLRGAALSGHNESLAHALESGTRSRLSPSVLTYSSGPPKAGVRRSTSLW
jgi:hypothetical protein